MAICVPSRCNARPQNCFILDYGAAKGEGMEMSGQWIWWIAAAILIGAELVTGTFYLLAIGVAAAIGGVAAFLGAAEAMQFAIAGVLGVVLTVVAHRWRLAPTPPTIARLRTGGPSPHLELRRDGARGLSRIGLGCRARCARHPARRNHVHRRDSRQYPRAFRPQARALKARPAPRSLLMTSGKLETFAMWIGSSFFTVLLFVVAIIVIAQAIRVVPQQHAWVVERLGRFYAVLQPGLNFVIPFVDRVAFKHDLREIPFDVPSQICITKDNTQLQVDGILYFQVTDPRLASYGSSNFRVAITQLAQTTLRSVIGRMELDRTFEEREHIN